MIFAVVAIWALGVGIIVVFVGWVGRVGLAVACRVTRWPLTLGSAGLRGFAGVAVGPEAFRSRAYREMF